MTVDDLPELATPFEVSKVLRCTPKWVAAQIKDGKLEAARIAGRYLITPAAVRKFIEGCVVPCQSRTVVPPSSGGTRETNGKSSGSSGGSADAEALARLIDKTLIAPSRTTSMPNRPKPSRPLAPVIQIR